MHKEADVYLAETAKILQNSTEEELVYTLTTCSTGTLQNITNIAERILNLRDMGENNVPLLRK